METSFVNACAYCGTLTENVSFCCTGCRILSRGFSGETPQEIENSFLDQPSVKHLYKARVSEAPDFDYRLYVEGMHCSSCVHLIEKLPFYNSSVEIARVDYARSLLFLRVKTDFSLAKVIQQISEMGYKARFLKSADDGDLIRKNENKVSLKKIAVAGACAGNIMLFVIPVYSGANGKWIVAFNWASFFLFLPIVLYSATSFYTSAWRGLRLRRIDIDLPIALALLSGFSLSTVNLIRGNGNIYFDSMASFIFLILCSRYFLRRIYQSVVNKNNQDEFESGAFLRIEEGQDVIVGISEIREGDLLRLRVGQTSPVDGIIQSEDALLNVSVLSGEPLPRRFEKGMELLAGSKVLSDEIVVRSNNLPGNSHLAKIRNQLRYGNWRKSEFVKLTDRLAQILILSVFVLSLITFAMFFERNPEEAFNRALALIVLACPCALALGSPLAMALAVKRAFQKGILIKNADVLERVLRIKNIFFDKTGTVTEGDLRLATSEPLALSEEIKTILISLEQKSYHPVAFALRKVFSSIRPVPVEGLTEVGGTGVEGWIESRFYEFGADESQLDSELFSFVLKENGKSICKLLFEDPIRKEARQTIGQLQSKGMQCYLLSGDCQERVDKVAKVCGMNPSHVYGKMSYQEKKEFIDRYEHSCMVGDGTNDALALKAADVGIAVKGSTSINLEAADIFFSKGGLSPLIELLAVAKDSRRVLVRNLCFAIGYNCVGGSLAIFGHVTPMLAAILMPISSLFIIASTLWGLK